MIYIDIEEQKKKKILNEHPVFQQLQDRNEMLI